MTLGLILLSSAGLGQWLLSSAGGKDAPLGQSGAPQGQQPVLAPTPRLDGLRVYLGVMYGCECEPPPKAGLIKVWAVSPDPLQRVLLLEAAVSGRNMRAPVELHLAPSSQLSSACVLFGTGAERGFEGQVYVQDEDDLPRQRPLFVGPPPTGEITVRLLVRDLAGRETWFPTSPDDVCWAVS